MLIPEKDIKNIRAFVDRYFVEDVLLDEPVTDEKVRILYYETEGSKYGGDLHIRQKFLEFDIYVRSTELYTADNDRLRRRDKMIGQRLKELLTGSGYVCNMRYTFEDAFALGSKTIGYRRYHLVFSYKTTH